MVFPSVRAIGHEGLWRIRQADYQASRDEVDRALAEEGCVLQAEEEGFFLVELEIGNSLVTQTCCNKFHDSNAFRWCCVC